MLLYRVSKARYASDLSGKGAELSGGRWNRIGLPAIYLAESVSLALLETIVHCQCLSDLHNRLILSIEAPDSSSEEVVPALLPVDWNTIPWHPFTIEYGTKWLESQRTLILKVPSAIVSQESIYILNPNHPGFPGVRIAGKETFRPDNRLALLFS
jgi:RES domain-containing protein